MAENSSRREPILCASLLHGQYIHILVICQILAELMCFEDVIINLMGGQRQAKCGMSKIACYIGYYKVISSIRLFLRNTSCGPLRCNCVVATNV